MGSFGADRIQRAAELVFVLGPRRVGKSFLLAPCVQGMKGIY